MDLNTFELFVGKGYISFLKISTTVYFWSRQKQTHILNCIILISTVDYLALKKYLFHILVLYMPPNFQKSDAL